MRRLLLTALLLTATPAAAALTPTPPQLQAAAYILMDARTGAVLAESRADEPFEPASLTKIMTTYMVFQALRDGLIQEQEPVAVSLKARQAPGSRMFLEVHSKVPVIDVLRGIIVQSGNDASIALAEHLAGSEEAFAEMMNAEAKRLHLEHSHFIDSSGLGGPDHYMSARDVAILSAAMINEFPDYYAMFRERDYAWNGIMQPNRNRLLWLDETVDGIKTGFTEAAQYCLAASARRPELDGMRLVSVVLGAASSRARIAESRTLLNWGFRHYRTRPVHPAQTPLTSTPVWFSGDQRALVGIADELAMTLPNGVHEQLETTFHLDAEVRAPLAQGQKVGWLAVRHEGRILHKLPTVALHDVPQGGFFSRLADHVRLWLN